MVDVSLDSIEEVSVRALIKHGALEWVAILVARAIRRAEETGNIICGLYYLESYCQQLKSGRVKGDVEPIVEQLKGGAVKSDALFGFAQSAFDRGYLQAVKSAKENGIASLAISNSHTCTSLGYFTEQIAAEGMIGLGFTNATAVVAPPGGTSPVIGTNPIAMTVPGRDGPALHFDFSTSAVALGKITMAKAAGEKLPFGWAIDSNGQPTTDPEAALAGTLCSVGGYKGWGFGLMSEIFSAGLTGSVNSMDVAALKASSGPPHGLGQFYIIIDQNTFTHDFDQKMERVTDAVSLQPGTRVPGTSQKINSVISISKELWGLVNNLV
ncbi:MAG: Ldh family oxidoreductase [Proteobacteria bacterium]|jgi:(2R)-3-sulfolactate dehydrogenase (NADP+)|nr:Ldh family oxidoreductase [Pseudomonadota bacterium]MDA1238464.1 Ldh family oxidoreductase [Pseudomonadota bacterium]